MPAVERKPAPARSSRRKPAGRSEEVTVDDDTVEVKGNGGKGVGDGAGDEADELDELPAKSKRGTPKKVEPPKKAPAKSKPKGKKSIPKEVDPVMEGGGDGNEGESVEVEPEEPNPRRGGRKTITKVAVVLEKKKRLTKKELAAAAKKLEEEEEEEEEEEKEIAETQYIPMQVDTPDPAEDEVAPTPTQVHTSNAASKKVSAEKKKRPTVSKGRGKSNKLQEQISEDHEGGSGGNTGRGWGEVKAGEAPGSARLLHGLGSGFGSVGHGGGECRHLKV